MKRLQLVLIITIIISFLAPLNVFAGNTFSEVVNSIGFEDIQPLLLDRNQTIISNLEAIDFMEQGSNSLDESLVKFKNYIDYFKSENGLDLDPTDPNYNTDPVIGAIGMLLDNQYLSMKMQSASSYPSANMKYNVEMGNNMLISGMEVLYITYNSLSQQLKSLEAKKKLVEKSVNVSRIQYELGMIAESGLKNAENQLKELESTINQLKESQNTILQQFNVNIGQDFDIDLVLEDVPLITAEDIDYIFVAADYEEAQNKSYKVLMENEYNKQIDEARKFKNDFYRAYQTILDKQKALEVEKEKMAVAENNIKFAEIKFKLGMISAIQFESEWSNFVNQRSAYKTAENALFQAYRAYEWAKNGLIVSSGSSSGASSGASGMPSDM